jgi:hypothetical protein
VIDAQTISRFAAMGLSPCTVCENFFDPEEEAVCPACLQIDANPYHPTVGGRSLYEGMAEGVQRLLQYLDRRLGPLSEDLRTCNSCKARVPIQEMGVKAVNTGDGYWEVGTSSVCGTCSENRSLGTKDEDGDHKAESNVYKRRLRDGFSMLRMHRKFGEYDECDFDDSNDLSYPFIRDYLAGR